MSVPEASEKAPEIVFPRSFAEAAETLAELGSDARLLAGGTWLMRSGARGETMPRVLVSLGRIEQADKISRTDSGWSIGPMATHQQIEAHFTASGNLPALANAAGRSANPGVRRLATVGGNVASRDFAPADLLTALIALDGAVRTVGDGKVSNQSLVEFMAARSGVSTSRIIAAIDVPDDGYLSAHARLALRQAGEYPVAIVSVAAQISSDRLIRDVRIAVGAVEHVPSRWHNLENELRGQRISLEDIGNVARRHLADFDAREGTDAPSWYRLDVLPHLLRGAFSDIGKQI
jgi:aerobic carbon-monoxide dehydrogenase medium subunit